MVLQKKLKKQSNNLIFIVVWLEYTHILYIYINLFIVKNEIVNNTIARRLKFYNVYAV